MQSAARLDQPGHRRPRYHRRPPRRQREAELGHADVRPDRVRARRREAESRRPRYHRGVQTLRLRVLVRQPRRSSGQPRSPSPTAARRARSDGTSTNPGSIAVLDGVRVQPPVARTRPPTEARAVHRGRPAAAAVHGVRPDHSGADDRQRRHPPRRSSTSWTVTWRTKTDARLARAVPTHRNHDVAPGREPGPQPDPPGGGAGHQPDHEVRVRRPIHRVQRKSTTDDNQGGGRRSESRPSARRRSRHRCTSTAPRTTTPTGRRAHRRRRSTQPRRAAARPDATQTANSVALGLVDGRRSELGVLGRGIDRHLRRVRGRSSRSASRRTRCCSARLC